jgi:hypothetical protein
MDALEIKKSQNIEQIMLLEEKKFLLARAHLALNACKKRREDLEHELSLLKTRMETSTTGLISVFSEKGPLSGM